MKWLATWVMNRIAGDRSSEWSLAMRREFDELETGHLGWAAGCIFAQSLNMAKREASFVVMLFLLPLISLVAATVVSFGLYYLLLKDSGVPPVVMSLPIIILQLPCAILLGMIRPWRAPLMVGALGFTSHQFFPQFLLWALLDAPFHFWWGPNVTIYNMTPIMGHACSIATWLGGAYFGARLGRRRLAG
jgi:hypothetical protein